LTWPWHMKEAQLRTLDLYQDEQFSGI